MFPLPGAPGAAAPTPTDAAASRDVAPAALAPRAVASAQRLAWAAHAARIAQAAGPAREGRDGRPGRVATVEQGDTLVGLVRQRWAAAGAPVAASDPRLYPAALRLAQAHGIADADRIEPGQRIDLAAAPLPVNAVASPRADMAGRMATSASPAAGGTFPLSNPAAFRLGAAAAFAVGRPTGLASYPVSPQPPPQPQGLGPARAEAAQAVTMAAGAPTAHPLLARTLDRAVARGYLPAGEQAEVRQRILALAQRHGFQPDDFARVTLLESDGLNPRASNGQCHGILQFCSGPGRGAASVGLGHDPGRILRLSVREQLELVDRYFDDTGLSRLARQKGGTVGLDDLYLTVLTPAAREVRHPGAALPIAGTQAAALYPGGDRRAPITRQSLLDGLQQHALDRLAQQGRRWLKSVGLP